MTPETWGSETRGTPSPRPWSQSHRKCADGWHRTQIYGPDGVEIASLAWAARPITTDGVIGTYREANADLIVRAVNSYDQMREALDRLLTHIDDCEGYLLTGSHPSVLAAHEALHASEVAE